jgi:diguanylate cyclase (GGDEF)-like protein
MEDAQKLDFSDPKSGEPGVILDSILTLLTKFTPQFQLHIMLFEETPLRETRSRVFIRDDSLDRLDWLQAREPGHSVWIPRASQLPRQLRKGEPDEKGHESSVVAVPLYDPSAAERNLVDRAEVGLLFLVTRQSWERDTLLRLASRLSRFVTHRWQQHSDVNKRIYVDALTGLFNRGYFDGQLALLVERARRNEAPLSLIIVDIDHFKSINDEFGHLVGDRVLKMVARRLQEELRRIDLVCRIGGEEIALVLPDADQDAAQEVTQRLLNSTFSERVTVDGQQIEVAVTFSFGGVTYPYAGSDSFQLYKQADALMYLSKDRGRNQCHFWSNDGNHLRLVPSTTQT